VTDDTVQSATVDPVVEPASPPNAGDVLDAVAALWIRVKPTMLGRVTVLEDATLALMEGILDDATRREAEREAHKVAGAVGTFGFASGSRLARTIELLFGSPTKLTYADSLRLADLVVELRRELEGEPSHQSPESVDVDDAVDFDDRSLLLISGDTDLSTSLEAEAAARGLSVRVIDDTSKLSVELEHARPDAVLLDLTTTRDVDVMETISEQQPDMPILVLADRISFADRVRIARSGARYALPKPQSPRRLVEAVLQALLTRTSIDARILAVDDDPEMLALLELILEPTGMGLTIVDSAERFWHALEESQPDLVILDLDMPEVDGLDLCRVLRNDLRRDDLPVLFLTVRTDPETTTQIFAAGADDFVAKPVVAAELLGRISNRLERVRTRRAMTESDPLTGLASRQKAEFAFDQFFRIAARQAVPVSLVIVDVDSFQEISNRHGRATADQVLRHLAHLMVQRFRGHDVATRWTGERFVVGMFGASRDIAVLRLTEVLETFQNEEFVASDGSSFTATFSAGIAEYPSDGRTLQLLYHAADGALCQANAAGPGRVIPSGWVGERRLVDHTIDVALVDDDDALAYLLLHALTNRGYRTEWFPDGEEAVRALAGSESRVQARVILLDVGLPSIDGFDVLRRLGDSGVARQSRVIMLTAHAAESEVLAALELGAFDHVAKPFSTPVLLQRIRRAMHG
jgi:diguanylate cyclase (GGDEF)-like protein